MKSKYLEDSAEDYGYVDQVVQKLYGCSDEQLLKELEEAKKNPPPVDFEVYPDEFNRIWEDIQAERQESQKGKRGKVRRFSWRRAAAIAVAACLMTGSACLVAWGTKTYFYRERSRGGIKGDIVFNNDLAIQEVNGEEEAYEVIEKELGSRPVRLTYVPSGMEFIDLTITHGAAVIKFEYKGKIIYFSCISNSTEASTNFKSDAQIYKEVHNKWFGQQIPVRQETTEIGTIKYEAHFANQDIVCELVGEIPEDEFVKILTGLKRFN